MFVGDVAEHAHVHVCFAGRDPRDAPPHEVYVPRRPPPAELEARRPSRDRHAPEDVHRSPQYPPVRRPSDPGGRADAGAPHHRNRGSDSNPGELSPEERCAKHADKKPPVLRGVPVSHYSCAARTKRCLDFEEVGTDHEQLIALSSKWAPFYHFVIILLTCSCMKGGEGWLRSIQEELGTSIWPQLAMCIQEESV